MCILWCDKKRLNNLRPKIDNNGNNNNNKNNQMCTLFGPIFHIFNIFLILILFFFFEKFPQSVMWSFGGLQSQVWGQNCKNSLFSISLNEFI